MSFGARRYYEVRVGNSQPQAGAYGSTGTLTFNSDGTMIRTSGLFNWAEPPQSGVGSSFWIRLTRTAGSGGVTIPNNATILSLATSPGYGAIGGAGFCSGTVEFFSDAGGTSLVASGTFSVTNAA